MPKRVNTIPVSDFQGGLNLNSNAFQLAKNESPQLLNVDLDPLGGFRRRNAVVETYKFTYQCKRLLAVPSEVYGTVLFALEGNGSGDFAFSYDGIDWSDVVMTANALDVVVSPPGSATEMAYVLTDGECEKWPIGDLSTTTLGTAFTESFVTPPGGNFVKARIGCLHRDFVFVADTNTDAIRANRVHFSHPGNAEAWREDDWFDVGDARPITAMASYKDTLLIFKQDSVWAVQGYDAETFSLSNISYNAGAVSANCVTESVSGVYFYSWPYGIYFFGDNGLEYKSAKLQEYISNKQMQPRNGNESLAWIDHRLYFSTGDWPSRNVLWEGIGPTFTFVLDPLLPNDSWTLYSFPTVGTGYYENGGTNGLVCAVGFKGTTGVSSDVVGFGVLEEEYTRVIRFTRNGNQTQGDLIDPVTDPETLITSWTPLAIESYYMTGWQDLGNTAVVKSWGRPIIVMGNLEDASLSCAVYKDYDSLNATMSPFMVSSDAGGADTMTWDTGLWDVDAWSKPVGNRLGIRKGRRIGRATAVAMKIKCSQQFKPWSVDSIVWKYIPKRVRS